MRRISLIAALVGCLLAGCGSHHSQSAGGSVHPPGWGGTPPGTNVFALAPSSVAHAEMFDSIIVATVPARPFAQAGYTAGIWPTFLPLRRAWPNAHTVSIAIAARYHADCLDVEPGDATASQAGAWARSDIAAGYPQPCLYTDLSNMPAVKANLRAWLGTGWRSRVLLWLAWYRYRPGLVAGYDAVQWSDHALGRNLDESTVTLGFLRYAHPAYLPAPPPTPKPKPKPVRHSARYRRLHYLIRVRCTPHAHHGYGRACRTWRREIKRA